MHQPLILSSEQRQLQEQLRRKHALLQQQIMKQHEELRLVNEQLIMAQYGVNIQQLCKVSFKLAFFFL